MIEPLTPREYQVLDYLAEGLTDAAIAARLDISIKTVRKHTSDLYAKLNVHNRTAAVAFYLRNKDQLKVANRKFNRVIR